MAVKNDAMEPFPFVPAMCMDLNFLCGLSMDFKISCMVSRPSFIPNLLSENISLRQVSYDMELVIMIFFGIWF